MIDTARFAGKAAIVTGATTGIGRAIALRLLAEGAQVMLAGRREANLAAAVAESGAGDRAAWQITDVSRAEDVAALVAATQARFGGVDILVNNAGIGAMKRIPDMSPDAWRTLFATDVDSIFHACRHAIPLMVERGGGAILNIASISGMGGDYGMGAYNAAKAAVINLTRAMAVDHALQGVRVNSISPGLIHVDSHEAIPAPVRAAWEATIPMQRSGTPADIAAAASFLVSDEAAFVTGHNLVIDGGATAHTGQVNLLKAFGM